jgi:hypothetical protein
MQQSPTPGTLGRSCCEQLRDKPVGVLHSRRHAGGEWPLFTQIGHEADAADRRVNTERPGVERSSRSGEIPPEAEVPVARRSTALDREQMVQAGGT